MQTPATPTDLLVTACHTCAQTAPTKLVKFRQNIGLLVMRLPSHVEGRFCKSCVRHHFWRTTLMTFVFGWWGILSFLVTLFILPMNAFTMLRAARLPEPRPRPLSWGLVLSLFAIGGAFVALGVLVVVADVLSSQDNHWNDVPVMIFFLALALVFAIAPGLLLWLVAIAGIRRGR